MSYIEKTLLPGEQILYYIRPHPIIFTRPLISLLVSFFFLYLGEDFYPLAHLNPYGFPLYLVIISLFFAVTLSFAINSYIYYKNAEYVLTNRRVLMKQGFIRRYSLEIFLKKIESIQTMQTIPGRLFNYGTVIINGIGGSKDYFFYIPKPLLFRENVQKQIEQN